MKAAIYTRVSRNEQVDGFSLDAQLEACTLFARSKNHILVQVYEERGESARTSRRPEFQQMLLDASLGKFQIVIVHKLDRFARNLRQLLALIEQLDEMNITVISVVENIDYSTPHGKLQLSIMGSVGEWYSNNLGDEVRKGKALRFREGKRSAPPPFGYMLDGDLAVPHPENAPALLNIFEMYQTGLHSQAALARWLKENDYRANAGNHILPTSMSKILRNIFYTGKIRHRDNIYEGVHEAIVPKPLFDQVQNVLAHRSQHKTTVRSTTTHTFVLTGVLRCACTGDHKYRGWRDPSGKAYYCSTFKECDNKPKMVFAHVAEQQFEEKVVNHLKLPRSIQKQIIAELKRDNTPRRDNQQIERSLKNLQKMFQWGDISEDEYRMNRDQLEEMLQPPPDNLPQVISFLPVLEDFSQVWQIATPAEKRELVRMLFARLILDGKELIEGEPTGLFWLIAGNSAFQNETSLAINLIPPAA